MEPAEFVALTPNTAPPVLGDGLRPLAPLAPAGGAATFVVGGDE